MRSFLCVVAATAFLSGCIAVDIDHATHNNRAEAAHHETGPVGATTMATLLNNAGAEIGTARFTEGPRGVLIQLDLAPSSLSPGWHGVHFHAVGDCHDHASGFAAASGHLGRGEGVTHGFLSPQGPEAGDLPNIFAPAAGPIRAEIFTHFVTLAAEDIGTHRLALMDVDGSALMIHANPDDNLSQPIGAAGARVACGVLARG
ncbi:MAG: superoxide dismutase family protein [Caulobacterales bacterium]|jgi:Cu-Zn family superoxide dismutase